MMFFTAHRGHYDTVPHYTPPNSHMTRYVLAWDSEENANRFMGETRSEYWF